MHTRTVSYFIDDNADNMIINSNALYQLFNCVKTMDCVIIQLPYQYFND